MKNGPLLVGAFVLLGCNSSYSAEQAVAAHFSDPEAVRFRNIHMADGKVCGELNAKNEFGGYVGYRPFMASAENDSFDPDFGPDDRGGMMKGFALLDATNVDACRYQLKAKKRENGGGRDTPQCQWVQRDRDNYVVWLRFQSALGHCVRT